MFGVCMCIYVHVNQCAYVFMYVWLCKDVCAVICVRSIYTCNIFWGETTLQVLLNCCNTLQDISLVKTNPAVQTQLNMQNQIIYEFFVFLTQCKNVFNDCFTLPCTVAECWTIITKPIKTRKMSYFSNDRKWRSRVIQRNATLIITFENFVSWLTLFFLSLYLRKRIKFVIFVSKIKKSFKLLKCESNMHCVYIYILR